jgi:hypothetical protein
MCLTELFQGQTASVGLSRMVVDNSALGVNFINILQAAFSFKKNFAQLFSNYSLALYFFSKMISEKGACKMLVKSTSGWSAIARQNCLTPGDRNPTWTDADLNYGVSYSYGYSMDSCAMISKQEMLAREMLFCTFDPLVGDNEHRCSGNQSVSYYRSFIDSNKTTTPDLPVFTMDSKPGLRRRFEKPCPADCIQDR